MRFENHIKYNLSCQAAVQTAAVCLGHQFSRTHTTEVGRVTHLYIHTQYNLFMLKLNA